MYYLEEINEYLKELELRQVCEGERVEIVLLEILMYLADEKRNR